MSLWTRLRARSDRAATTLQHRHAAELLSVPARRSEASALAAHRRISRNARRVYDMSEADRLASTWSRMTTTADGTVRYALATLRARARELAENDPYIARLWQMLDENVVGELGIRPVPEPRSSRSSTARAPLAERRILEGFTEWAKPGKTTVCGRYGLASLQKRIIRSVGTDGEVFLVEVYGEAAGNEFGYALELLEADLVDETHNEELPNGNVVRMGVEMNRYRRPVAFWFLTEPPGDYFYPGNRRNVERRRVPADRVIVCRRPEAMRPGQTRAVTWLTTVGQRLYQLLGYHEAEAAAARWGAAKMGFLQAPPGEEYNGEALTKDGEAFLEAVEPGSIEILPEGWEFKGHDPDHPSTAFGPFTKSLLRSIAAGLGVSYNSLARDLEGVSYGSLRQDELADRSHYRNLRQWIVEDCGFRDRIYPNWLSTSLLFDAVKLDPGKLDLYVPHRWQARGWRWLDPDKESKGDDRALRNATRTVEDVVAETTGRTLDEHLDRVAKEREKFAALGIPHPIDAVEAPPDEPEPQGETDE